MTLAKVNRIYLNNGREFRSKLVMEWFNWINQEEFEEQGLMVLMAMNECFACYVCG